MTTRTDTGWMVCSADGMPAGRLCANEVDARAEQRQYPVGCDYHVRPVRVTTEVLGEPPRPWCFVVAAAWDYGAAESAGGACECGALHVAMHGGHDPRCPAARPSAPEVGHG